VDVGTGRGRQPLISNTDQGSQFTSEAFLEAVESVGVDVRDRAKINSVFMAQRFWSLARRERRAYPASGSVRSEPRSQRPKDQAGNAEVIFARSLRLEARPVARSTSKRRDWAGRQRQKLIKIGAKVVRHSRKIVFQMAEVAVPRELLQAILGRIGRLRLATAMSG
jgi:hypothetical protein